MNSFFKDNPDILSDHIEQIATINLDSGISSKVLTWNLLGKCWHKERPCFPSNHPFGKFTESEDEYKARLKDQAEKIKKLVAEYGIDFIGLQEGPKNMHEGQERYLDHFIECLELKNWKHNEIVHGKKVNTITMYNASKWEEVDVMNHRWSNKDTDYFAVEITLKSSTPGKTYGEVVRFASVHAPYLPIIDLNESDKQKSQSVNKFVQNCLKNKNSVVVGDFNSNDDKMYPAPVVNSPIGINASGGLHDERTEKPIGYSRIFGSKEVKIEVEKSFIFEKKDGKFKIVSSIQHSQTNQAGSSLEDVSAKSSVLCEANKR